MAVQVITGAQLIALVEADLVEWPPVVFAGKIYAIRKAQLGDPGRIIYEV